jgi:hypothetical protein
VEPGGLLSRKRGKMGRRDNRPAELADVLRMEIIHSDIEYVLSLSFEFLSQRGATTLAPKRRMPAGPGVSRDRDFCAQYAALRSCA